MVYSNHKKEDYLFLKKYVKRTSTTRSLNGNITHCFDYWGALLYQFNTFGDFIGMYDTEQEYLDATNHLRKVKKVVEDARSTR